MENKNGDAYPVVNLDLREMLPVIRTAFDNKELQAFTTVKPSGGICLYAGPCAIGVCIPEDKRALYDIESARSGTAALTFMANDVFVAPKDQVHDISELQQKHDAVISDWHGIGEEACLAELDKFIKSLEEKYL